MPFAFALTNPGLEKLLIHEVHTRFPDWRLAFSAPGFVTFKGDEGKAWPAPFLARLYGECIGKNVPTRSDCLDLDLGEKGRWVLKPTMPGPFWEDRQQLSHLELPTEAPSRAWLKVEEAIRLYGLKMGEGDCALEVGAAPGGACYALLNRGVQVIGVDPAEMDPIVTQNSWFTHIKKPFQELTPRETAGVDWWLSDLNLAPGSVLSHLGRLLRESDKPKGLLLTLKIGKPDVVLEIAEHEKRVREWGYRTQVRLLPSHHTEVLLVALS